jgi:hypothetical protein
MRVQEMWHFLLSLKLIKRSGKMTTFSAPIIPTPRRPAWDGHGNAFSKYFEHFQMIVPRRRQLAKSSPAK